MANLIIILFIKRGFRHLIVIIICMLHGLHTGWMQYSAGLAVVLAVSLLTWQIRKYQHCIFFHTCVFLSWYRAILAHVVHITLDTVFHKPFPFWRWNGTIYLSNAGLSETHYIEHFFPSPNTAAVPVLSMFRANTLKLEKINVQLTFFTPTHLLAWSHSKHGVFTVRTFLSAT